MKAKTCLLSMLFCVILAISMILSGCSGEAERPVSSDSPTQSESTVSTADNDEVGSTEGVLTGTAAELGCLKSFSAGTLEGGSFTQDDIFAKDMTIINFWALTCPPCIGEMPDLADFAKKLPDHVQMITVCLDALDDEEGTKSILSEAGYEGVTLISGDGDLLEVCNQLQYTPTTVLVDSKGNLVGDSIIGTCEDLTETYLTAVNTALKAGGKAEISLEP